MSKSWKRVILLTMLLPSLIVTRPALAADGSHVTEANLVPAFESDLPVGTAPTQSTSGEMSSQSINTCTIFASDPRKEGGLIAGDGSQACSAPVAQAITVTLQQYRSFGIWATKAQVHGSEVSDFLARRAAWVCDGTGSGMQTYRVITDGRFTDIDGATYSADVQSANYLEVFCS